MNSRQIIIDVLEHNAPPRIGFTHPDPFKNDIFFKGTSLPNGEDWKQVDESRWERKDMWGNIWARVDPTSKGEIHKGALDDLDTVADFPLPPLNDPVYYESVAKAVQDNSENKFIQGGIPGFVFNIARKLRRLDQYFMDLIIEKEKIRILHDRLEELLTAMIKNYGACGVDGIGFAEDWGTQEGLFINPELFREEFKPRFERLCRTAHDCGLFILMHSCGKITDVIPDMIEAGVDAFQFDQPQLHGLETLGSFSDRATFWCPVDIQKTLQTKDKRIIQDKAKEMIRSLWKNGGFIAGYYGDNVSIGLEPEVQEWACEAFAEWGSDLTWLG
jgi:hypothetical protein